MEGAFFVLFFVSSFYQLSVKTFSQKEVHQKKQADMKNKLSNEPDYQKNYSLKTWAEDDKPREKLLNKGKNALSDAELIAILINSGNRKETAVDLSRRILKDQHDNLIELSRMSVHDLMQYSGIGEAKAISIVAALELGKRRRQSEALELKQIKSSRDAFECLYAHVADQSYEQFWVLFLDRANQILQIKQISDGGVSGTVADPKKIFSLALECRASGIILCHNHPSGQLSPSPQDTSLTKKLSSAGDMLEIKVLDHLIIGKNAFYSFADEGML
jgi:DNA repair protein RadC